MINFLPTILEFICIYTTAKLFLKIPLYPNKKDYLSCFIITLPTIIIPSRFTIFIWTLGQLLYMFYIAKLKKDNLINRLILYCLSYTTVLLIQFILISILSVTRFPLNNTFMPIIGNILTLLLITILFKIESYNNLYKIIAKSAIPYKLLLVNSYLILVAVLLYLKLNSHKFYSNLAYLFTILVFIIFTNICILYYDQKLFIKQQELLSYQKNLPIYKSLIDEIRANQHEFTNRIQTLGQLPLVCADYESLCHALQSNTQNYNISLHTYPLLQINMPILAATLYNLHCYAEKLNISLIFDISSLQIESYAPEYQLADFVCILTQNAIEACKKNDKIYIHFSSQNKTFHFEIRNPIDRTFSIKETTLFFQKGYSTKHKIKKESSTPHGFGLFYLSNTIKSYNGVIGVDCARYDDINWIIFTLDV